MCLNPCPVFVDHYRISILITLPDGDRLFIRFTGIERGQSCCIGATFIDGYDLWFTVLANSFAEKAECCRSIPFSRQQEINVLARGIDCPVQIFSLSFNFDVGFAYPPPMTLGAFSRRNALFRRGTRRITQR